MTSPSQEAKKLKFGLKAVTNKRTIAYNRFVEKQQHRQLREAGLLRKDHNATEESAVSTGSTSTNADVNHIEAPTGTGCACINCPARR